MQVALAKLPDCKLNFTGQLRVLRLAGCSLAAEYPSTGQRIAISWMRTSLAWAKQMFGWGSCLAGLCSGCWLAHRTRPCGSAGTLLRKESRGEDPSLSCHSDIFEPNNLRHNAARTRHAGLASLAPCQARASRHRGVAHRPVNQLHTNTQEAVRLR